MKIRPNLGDKILITYSPAKRLIGRIGTVQKIDRGGKIYGTWGATSLSYTEDRFKIIKDE